MADHVSIQFDSSGHETSDSINAAMARSEDKPASSDLKNDLMTGGKLIGKYNTETGEMEFTRSGSSGLNVATEVRKSSDPLDSAIGAMGEPLGRSQLTPDSIIEGEAIGGSMQLRTAENLGWVKKVNGEYVFVGPDAKGVPQEQPQDKPGGPASLDAPVSTEGLATSPFTDIFMSTTKKAAGDQLFNGTLMAAIKGTDLSSFVNDIAQRTQQTPADVREGIEAARAEFERTGREVAQRAGVPASAYEDFTDWAEQTHPDLAQDAAMDLAEHHNINRFTRLARMYARTGRAAVATDSAPSDADLLGAEFGSGIKAVRTSQGVRLEIDGRHYTYAEAVKADLVRVRRG